MTQKKHQLRVALREEAIKLVHEVLDGQWDHIEGIQSTPIGLLTPMHKELERRSPGLPQEAYQDAYCRAVVVWCR